MSEARRINYLAIVPVAVVAVLLGAVFLPGLFREDAEFLPSTREGLVAPPVEPTPLGDYPVFGEAELNADGIKMVNFWASWCVPCRAEHPKLVAFAEEFPVYGINRDTSVSAAEAFLDELGNPFSGIVQDVRNNQSLEWGVYGLPETFLIDGDGKVILHFRGVITQRSIDRVIRPAIEAAKRP